MKKGTIFAGAAVLSALAASVYAGTKAAALPVCLPLKIINDGLAEVEERPVWRGLDMEGVVTLVLYSREDGRTWSLVAINENSGAACIVRIGTGSKHLTAKKGEKL